MDENSKVPIEDVPDEAKKYAEAFRIPARFQALNHLISQDLNDRMKTPTIRKFKKTDILKFLKNPYSYEKQLRDACISIYASSSNFRRLIQYFTSLTDLAYVVAPFGVDVMTASNKTISKRYNRVIRCMESFHARSQFPQIITVCMREDVYYGTLWVTPDDITIQRLPSDYCKIASVEGNVFNVSFDFHYFDRYPNELKYFPQEFSLKYEEYKSNRRLRWKELDSPTSFAIKCTSDIAEYPLPPFAGVLAEIYDLEDYKAMRLTRTEMENYAILVMKLALGQDGTPQVPFDTAKSFWLNLADVLPEQIGSVLSPMSIEKISFDRAVSPESNAVSNATNLFWDASGVSSLLFNNNKSSSNALLLSIKADQAITYGIVKSIGEVVNRYIQSTSYGRNFRVTFLDTSPYNRDEVGSQYLKMCQIGMPMVSYLAATYGMSQSDMNSMNYLEDEILKIKDRFVPLRSTSTMSSDDVTSDAGRPASGLGEVTDGGEKTQERDEGN